MKISIVLNIILAIIIFCCIYYFESEVNIKNDKIIASEGKVIKATQQIVKLDKLIEDQKFIIKRIEQEKELLNIRLEHKEVIYVKAKAELPRVVIKGCEQYQDALNKADEVIEEYKMKVSLQDQIIKSYEASEKHMIDELYNYKYIVQEQELQISEYKKMKIPGKQNKIIKFLNSNWVKVPIMFGFGAWTGYKIGSNNKTTNIVVN